MLDRRQAGEIYGRHYHDVVASLAPNCPGERFSGKQVDYAKAEARRRTVAEIESRGGR